MLEKQQKPVFLNLFQIAMPVTAIVSILHRISGLLLVLFLPVLIYVFYLSTNNKDQFNELLRCFDSTIFKFIIIGLFWAIAHHIIAGIRYLLIDIEIGLTLPAAKLTAWFANILAAVITVIFALELLL